MNRAHLPIAIGFYLLAAPLVVAVFLSTNAVGVWTNAVAAVVLLGLGVVLNTRSE